MRNRKFHNYRAFLPLLLKKKLDKMNNNNTTSHSTRIDIYRTLHSLISESTFFPSARDTFSKTEHTQGDKTTLNIFKKSKTIQSAFPIYNSINKISVSRENPKDLRN